MLNIGDRVRHHEYGLGEVITTKDEIGKITVAFEKEYEVLTGSVIDNDYYFEDNRRLEKTKVIQVHHLEVEKIKRSALKERNPNCHSCKKAISTNSHLTCNDCNWILCDCGSCGCNYVFNDN